MKKLTLILCLGLLACALAGCGQPVEKAPAAPRPLKEAVAAVAADAGELVAIPAADLEDVLGIPPEDYSEFVYLQENSLSGREILVLRAADAEAAQRVRGRVEAYLERRRKETDNYLPEAYKLLMAAKVEVKNHTVALIVGEQAADEVRKLMAGE